MPVAVATLLSQVGTVARMGRPLLDGCSLHYTERAQDRFATKSVIADRSESGRAATVPIGLPDLVCPERGNADRLAIERHELNFVSPAASFCSGRSHVSTTSSRS